MSNTENVEEARNDVPDPEAEEINMGISRTLAECLKLNETQVNDMVNSPSHYMKGGLEVIDILRAKLSPEQFRGFLLGNLLKYTMRFEHKGQPIQDLKKAKWYLDQLTLHEEDTMGG